jgi:hypothetical protein
VDLKCLEDALRWTSKRATSRRLKLALRWTSKQLYNNFLLLSYFYSSFKILQTHIVIDIDCV